MTQKKSRVLLSLLSLLVAALLCCGMATPAMAAAGSGKPVMTVHFLDVGQADCILVQLPNRQTLLIDGGNEADARAVNQYLTARKIDAIDYLVATHPHEDHIGGLPSVIENRAVTNVYMPNAVSATRAFESLLTAIQNKKAAVKVAKAGATILSADDLNIQIVAPCSERYDNLNNHSAVVKLTYGKTSFLFAGDAEADSEKEIQADIRADVLKVGHHGSDTSTSPEFLKKVSPQRAVISVGKDNRYGHPEDSVVRALNDANATVYRTDESGTIVMTSDGEKIAIRRQRTPAQPNAPPKAESSSSAAPKAESSAPAAESEPKAESGAPAVESAPEPQSITVYVTDTGEKYHRDGCQYLRKSKHAVSLEQAKRSYGPCSRCKPPQ